MEAPDPPESVPVQATDAQALATVAVPRPPERNVLAFPLLGNEMRIGEQEVEDVGVERMLLGHFLVEVVTFHPLAVLLTFGEPESVLLRFLVPLELAALVVLDGPAVFGPRVEGLSITVDDVLNDRNGSVSEEDLAKLAELISLREKVHQLGCPCAVLGTVHGDFDFVRLSAAQDEPVLRHVLSPYEGNTFLLGTRCVPVGSEWFGLP